MNMMKAHEHRRERDVRLTLNCYWFLVEHTICLRRLSFVFGEPMDVAMCASLFGWSF